MANTYSTDLERSSSQSWSITDASQTGLDLTGDLTFECWVKPESAPSASKFGLITKQSGSNESYQFNYRESSGLRLQFVTSDDGGGTGEEVYTQTVDLGTGTWRHVAMTFDASASTAEFFVDGKSIGTDTGTNTSIYSGTAPVYIGAGNAADYFDGLLDDVRIWNDVRTDSEILTNMQSQLAGTESGLAAYWQFNNDGLDQTSNNNDLTNNNSATFSTDSSFISRSIDLESGSSQYLSAADSASLEISGDFTYETWIKFESLPTTGNNIYIANRDPDDNSNRVWALSILNTSGTYSMRAYNSSAGTNATTTGQKTVDMLSAPVVDTWYHLAWTFTSGTLETYVNGTSQGTASGLNSSMYASGSSQLTIGAYDTGVSNFTDGLVDEIRIWSDARTDAEIDDNKCATLDGTEANLVGYWRLDNNYVDQSGNGNLLTPNASPVFSTDPFNGNATCGSTGKLLVVAGGGGGDNASGGAGGAGGAGGYQANDTYPLAIGTYDVVVGSGGATETQGDDSTFASLVSVGGGRGNNATVNGGDGGSGGGTADTGTGGVGIAGQGFDGGDGNGSYNTGSGGGGSSAVGADSANASNGAAGGAGTANTITGSSVTYAGGGGGGSNGAGGSTGGAGGTGGGGAGGDEGATHAVAGTANTGGGGGGDYSGGAAAGAGGSGVVIIAYTTADFDHTGGDSTGTDGSLTYVQFNSSGTFTLSAAAAASDNALAWCNF